MSATSLSGQLTEAASRGKLEIDEGYTVEMRSGQQEAEVDGQWAVNSRVGHGRVLRRGGRRGMEEGIGLFCEEKGRGK